MTKRHAWLTAAAMGIALAAVSEAQAATVSISCGAVGQELKFCQEGAEAWAKATGNEVKIVSTPNSATDRLGLYQQILAAGSGDIDVLQIDVVWPSILASHLLSLDGKVDSQDLAKHFKAIVDNNTVKGELKAIPWFTDAGLLYYRKDLLEKHGLKAPSTWAELSAAATAIQAAERAGGNDRMWGYVYQGKAYEGLTCNALEWIDSFGGGTIVDGTGAITIANPKAAQALEWAAAMTGVIAPEGVLNYEEEEARGVFQSGNAVFMRNWPYAWALAQAPDSPVKDKVGVAALPKGGAEGKPTGTLGGWQLAVSRYSKNQAAAIDLVKYLTSQEEQKRRAIGGSFNPTIEALYDDPEIAKAAPFMSSLKATFVNAVARPSRATGARYNQASAEFFNTVHAVLSGQAKAGQALEDLGGKLDRLSRGGRW